MRKQSTSEFNDIKDVSVFTAPQWIAVFFIIAVPASLGPFLIGFALGFSVESDIVFGVYALISGVFSDYIIRKVFNRSLLLFIKPRIPFIIVWFLLCLYVILFSPLK